MPTARFYNESSFGITVYDGNPDQKITLSSFHLIGLKHLSFIRIFKTSHIVFMTLIQFVIRITKTKVLILRLRLKEEGVLPAIAVGINDIAGTGLLRFRIYCWQLWS